MSLNAIPTPRTVNYYNSLVYLGEQVANASATLDFTSLITSLYDEYVFQFFNIVPATDGTGLYMKMSTNNGSSWAGGTDYSYRYLRIAGATAITSGDGVAQVNLTEAIASNNSLRGIVGEITLFSPNSTTVRKMVSGQLFVTQNGGGSPPFEISLLSGVYNSTSVVNAVQFLMSSGNITSGSIRIYGVSKNVTAPQPAVELIESISPSGTGTITFSSIPQIYSNLEVRYTARSTVAAVADNMLMRFNGDTGANYDRQLNLVSNTTFVGQEAIAGTSAGVGNLSGASAAANLAGSGKISIANYRTTEFYKYATCENVYHDALASGGIKLISFGVGWRSTVAISSITLFLGASNFLAGSKFDLYGYR
jgi:hypothetical protein